MEQSKIPVTVLTGFLGSGKTTLLNRILTENHGKKIAVIENEFGEVGVDNELVIGVDEEIFEMNNGCICCTVRGDLIRILSQLTRRKDRLDHIIIETTGMANPSPVAQTFWVDEEIQEEYALDAIVTIVDAKHVWQRINDSDECKEQIAFADVLLLNKTDLVSSDELKKLAVRIQSINGQAKIFYTKNAAIGLEHILNIKAFDLDAKVEINPTFLEEEYPYEWSGYYKLDKGLYTFVLKQGPDAHMNMVVLPVADLSHQEQTKAAKRAIYQFSEREQVNYASPELPKVLLNDKNQLDLRQDKQVYYLEIGKSGYYGLFTEHVPEEFDMLLLDDHKELEPVVSHEHGHSHEHDESIISVGIKDERPLSIQKVNNWLSYLLDYKGLDIYRMKGIMNIAGNDDRFVFQGVHMLFDGKADRKWKADETRRNQIIFIGKNLNKEEILAGFELCVA